MVLRLRLQAQFIPNQQVSTTQSARTQVSPSAALTSGFSTPLRCPSYSKWQNTCILLKGWGSKRPPAILPHRPLASLAHHVAAERIGVSPVNVCVCVCIHIPFPLGGLGGSRSKPKKGSIKKEKSKENLGFSGNPLQSRGRDRGHKPHPLPPAATPCHCCSGQSRH